jgi:D-amino-acid dehydrogenase
MARTDALVLGAGIVGTSVALHLAKRGLSVTLVDKRGPGEETSYGNTGVIVGASIYPTAFPRSLKKLMQIALKRAPEANYHLGGLLRIAPWLIAYYGFSIPEKLKDSAIKMRPLMSRSVAEHKALLEESGALTICARPAGLRFTAATPRSRPSSRSSNSARRSASPRKGSIPMARSRSNPVSPRCSGMR